MSRYRAQRLPQLLKERISEAIIRNARFDEGLVTVLSVQLDKKGEHARIHIAVFPDDKKREVLLSLNRQAGEFAHQLLKEIRIAKIPRLEFV